MKLMPGKSINETLKELSKFHDSEYLVSCFTRGNEAGFQKASKVEQISTDDSAVPAYLYCLDRRTVYWYTDGKSDLVLPEDASSLFDGLDELSQIDPTGLEGSQIKSAARMFFGCTQLENPPIDFLNHERLEDISELFAENDSLSEFDFSRLSRCRIRNMNSMFADCHSLKKVNFQGFPMETVEDMGALFWNCRELDEKSGCYRSSRIMGETS